MVWIMISAIVYVATLVATLLAIYRYEKRYSTSEHVPVSQRLVTMAWHLGLSLTGAGVAIAITLGIENRRYGGLIVLGIVLLTMVGQIIAMMLGRGAAQRRS